MPAKLHSSATCVKNPFPGKNREFALKMTDFLYNCINTCNVKLNPDCSIFWSSIASGMQ